MKQHLIVLDLDGTLLTNDQRILPRTKRILQQLMNEGHIVMIATGRPYRASLPYYEELGLQTPIVNFNGALTHHPLDASWSARQHYPIDLPLASEVIAFAEERKVHNMIAEVKDDVYLEKEDDQIMHIFGYGEPKIVKGRLRESLAHHPTNLLLQTDAHSIEQLQKDLTTYFDATISQYNWGSPLYIVELVRTGLHKALGIRQVARYYNIPRERIIAFGDEENDLEMIDYAGVGVAMANGIEPLRQIANATTKSNEEDGIAWFLEGYFQR